MYYNVLILIIFRLTWSASILNWLHAQCEVLRPFKSGIGPSVELVWRGCGVCAEVSSVHAYL